MDRPGEGPGDEVGAEPAFLSVSTKNEVRSFMDKFIPVVLACSDNITAMLKFSL